MITWCSSCDGVHTATRDKDPWQWRCAFAPTRPGYKFVHPTFSPDPPFARCADVNGGNCPMFTPRRNAAPPDVKERSMRHA